jgi:hypothetical protein
MEKILLIILIFIFIAIPSRSQRQSQSSDCWKVDSVISDRFFHNLFISGSRSDPTLTLIKLDFEGVDIICIAGIQIVQSYCKIKYKIPDSAIRKFTMTFIQSGQKLPVEDTTLMAKLDNQFYSFTSKELQPYRQLGVRNFMLKYCEGGKLLLGSHMHTLAFLFENRIFWGNLSFRIESIALAQIEYSCKIRWDPRRKMWINTLTKKRALPDKWAADIKIPQ